MSNISKEEIKKIMIEIDEEEEKRGKHKRRN